MDKLYHRCGTLNRRTDHTGPYREVTAMAIEPNTDPSEQTEEQSEHPFDQTLFPAIYEMHRRGYEVVGVSMVSDWEMSITMGQVYLFRDLPEYWMQCGQDLVYRHRPRSDRYDRKYGAFLLYGWACRLPVIPEKLHLTSFYQGVLETMVRGAPDPRERPDDLPLEPGDLSGARFRQ